MNVSGGVGAATVDLLALWRLPSWGSSWSSSFDTASLSPVIERVGWTLVHFTWEGLLVAAVLALTLRAMRQYSSAARYGVSCLAMALLVALPVVTFFCVRNTSTVWLDTDELTRIALAADANLADATATNTDHAPPADLRPSHYPLLPPLERVRSMFPWLVGGWAGGVALLALWHSVGWLRIRRLCRLNVHPMSEAWGILFAEVAERVGVRRAVRLFESTRASVPMVIGWLRPVILVPASAVSGLTVAQLEAILAHELAHVRRFDYLVNLIQVAAETLLFYHPAVWWVSGRIRTEREHCCDDLAAAATPGGAVAYARALAKLEELRMPLPLPHDPLRLVPAATTGSLLNRVRRLLGHGEYADRDVSAETSPRSRPIAAAVLVAAAIAAGALAPFAGLPGAIAADTAPTTPATADSPGDRPLNAEDVIRVTVTGPDKQAVKMKVTARISPQGSIPLPHVGKIQAAGLTAGKLEQQIARIYGPEGVNLDIGDVKVSYAPPGATPDAEPTGAKGGIRLDGEKLDVIRLAEGQAEIANVNAQLSADLVRVQAQGDVKIDTTEIENVQTQLAAVNAQVADVNTEVENVTQQLQSTITFVPDGVTRLDVVTDSDLKNSVQFQLQSAGDDVATLEFTDTPDVPADKSVAPGKPRKVKKNSNGQATPEDPAADKHDSAGDDLVTTSADGKEVPVLGKIPYVGRLFRVTKDNPASADKANREAKAAVLSTRLAEIQARLAQVRRDLGGEHPKVKALVEEEAKLKSEIADLTADPNARGGGDKSDGNRKKSSYANQFPQTGTFSQSGATPAAPKRDADVMRQWAAKREYEITIRKADEGAKRLADQEQRLQKLKFLKDSGNASPAELDRAKVELERAKAELARVKAEFEKSRRDESDAAGKNDLFRNNRADGRDQVDFERDLARRKLEVLNEEMARAEVEQAKAHAMAAQQADKQKAEAQLKALEVQREQLRAAFEEQAQVAERMEKRRAEMQRDQQAEMKRMEAEQRETIAKQQAMAREAKEYASRAAAVAERARAEAMSKEAEAKAKAQQDASGEYFISGVPQPGSRPVRTGGRQITLLQALVAGGLDPAKASGSEVIIVRQPSDPNSAVQRESVPVDDVVEGKQRPVQSGDVILVRPGGRGNRQDGNRQNGQRQ